MPAFNSVEFADRATNLGSRLFAELPAGEFQGKRKDSLGTTM